MDKLEDSFYEEICEKYFKDVYQFCIYLTKGNRSLNHIVEECVQETFLEAKKQIKKLKNHPNVKGWLYVTSRNMINSSMRKYYTKNKHEIPIYEEVACSSTSVEEELENISESGIDIDKLKIDIMKQLKEEEYQFYIDCFIKKMPVKEIAEKYNISISATYTRIHRLRVKIKKMVERYFYM